MSRQAKKKQNPKDFPEFPVKREVICSMFTPPLPKSTFYDRVEEGKIIRMAEMPGFYLLNATLHRLGLPLVTQPPVEIETRSIEDIVCLAFSLIDPRVFPEPAWLLNCEAIDMKDVDHARRIARQHRDAVETCEPVQVKLAYFQGVLDARHAIRKETEGDD
ncbi:hypothetical protein [Haloferula sp. A504]|uniref:hypothetical protein n=1 Tax=Haloferula sp. A504 TaxID=3373601 RepID=UPI0031CA9AA8|nr:hypothetical protein [Verrucomicrobiaceae bacterium E54]